MTWWFEGRAAPLNVTLVAVTGSSGIVNPRAANEGCRGMTEGAIQGGRNVIL